MQINPLSYGGTAQSSMFKRHIFLQTTSLLGSVSFRASVKCATSVTLIFSTSTGPATSADSSSASTATSIEKTTSKEFGPERVQDHLQVSVLVSVTR